MTKKRQIAYIDMDGVVADFDSRRIELGIPQCPTKSNTDVPTGFFKGLDLIPGAFNGVHKLSRWYDIYFLSTPQWSNPDSWKEKREWIEDKFPIVGFKRLILTHNKGLALGDYLIDDNVTNGVKDFRGKHIHFGSCIFPDWEAVIEYFTIMNKKNV